MIIRHLDSLALTVGLCIQPGPPFRHVNDVPVYSAGVWTQQHPLHSHQVLWWKSSRHYTLTGLSGCYPPLICYGGWIEPIIHLAPQSLWECLLSHSMSMALKTWLINTLYFQQSGAVTLPSGGITDIKGKHLLCLAWNTGRLSGFMGQIIDYEIYGFWEAVNEDKTWLKSSATPLKHKMLIMHKLIAKLSYSTYIILSPCHGFLQ